MPWSSPAAFLGEFDAQEGPRINYAFEYYGYSRDMGWSISPSCVNFVGGKALVGKHVAGGTLREDYFEFARGIAARALTSNEAHEDSMLSHDTGLSPIGSFSFCLPDILARGEKRRFCLVFIHRSYDVLVSRWLLISQVVRVLIDEWTHLATARYTREYSTIPNLEQQREQARRRPLRSITALLRTLENETQNADACSSPGSLPEASLENTGKSVDVEPLRRIHCLFEAGLPIIFSSDLNDVTWGHLAPGRLPSGQLSSAESPLRLRMDTDAIVADASTSAVDFSDATTQWKQGCGIVVKPLVVWLAEWASRDASDKMWAALESLLFALFSGNQILVLHDWEATRKEADDAASDAADAANLALALAYCLPPKLARVKLFATEYVMPYASRIVSFGESFLASRRTVLFRTPSTGVVREQFVLSEIESEGVVCVSVSKGEILNVVECGDLVRAVACTSPQAQADTPCTRNTSTLGQRTMSLLRMFIQQTHVETPESQKISGGSILFLDSNTAEELRLIDAQIHQLVREYVVRGRVYSDLFRKQEVRANSSLLQALSVPTGSHGSTSSSSCHSRRERFFSSIFGFSAAAHEETGVRNRRRRLQRGPLSSSVEHSSSLSVEANRMFGHSSFVFSSSSKDDHDVLIFLGSDS